MSNETLGIIFYFIIMITWMVYIMQESFITGSSALNMAVSKNEGERKQIQVTTGIHWDGIEVWLIGTLTLTLAAFPLVFATIFEYLYIPIFLLLYSLIARGIAIEVLYKLDSKRWTQIMVIAWTVSSILIMLILGVYLTNIFLGFHYDGSEMTKSFASIFNITTISGGLLFVATSFLAGAGWISLTTTGGLGEKALLFVKKTGVIYSVPVFLMLAFMGLNNQGTSIFVGELFSKSFLFFLLPLLTVVAAIMSSIYGRKENGKKLFIFSLLTIGLFLMTGFVGSFPYLMPSRIAFENGISIKESMAESNALTVVLIAVMIFYPIIIFYQSWKYKKFTKKIKYNDE